MLIKKDSNVAYLINEFLKENEDGVEETSIIVSNGIFCLYNKDKYKISTNIETDISFSTNNYKILFVMNEVLKTEDLEITKEDFDVSINTDINESEDSEKCISFTNKQFTDLEKFFVLTKSNWVTNPSLVDVINIGIKEGTLYKVIPSTIAYNIGKFDATVDETTLNSLFGHEVVLYSLPKKIFDIVKKDEKIDIGFSEEYSSHLYVKSSNFNIECFKAKRDKTSAFEKYVQMRFNDGEDFSSILKLDEYLKYINDISYSAEDENIGIAKNTNTGKLDINLFETKISTDIEAPLNFNLVTNLYGLKFLLKEPIETFKTFENLLGVKCNNDYYFLSSNA